MSNRDTKSTVGIPMLPLATSAAVEHSFAISALLKSSAFYRSFRFSTAVTGTGRLS